ncbi:MAG: ABC transporter permease [Solirubrobacteraceae bacterium]|nr:ABC transporter permease [Solirubrobacteraceae bacterium]
MSTRPTASAGASFPVRRPAGSGRSPRPGRRGIAPETILGPLLLVGLVVGGWHVMASTSDSTLLPGLGEIGDAIGRIVGDGAASTLWVTVVRVLLGFTLAFVAAIAAGLLMARSRWARAILEPAVLIGLTVPGLVWALLAVIWFGLAQTGPVLAVALSAAPPLVLNVYQGAKAVDPGLIEMAHVFRFDRRTRLTRLWLPALVPFLLSGARLGLSLSWKVIVLVEMFGASEGVGYELNTAFSDQDVAAVLAWTIVFGVVMVLIEYGILRTVERRVTRWRKAAIV